MRRDSPRYGNFPKRRKSRERPWNRASPAFGKLWEHVGNIALIYDDIWIKNAMPNISEKVCWFVNESAHFSSFSRSFSGCICSIHVIQCYSIKQVRNSLQVATRRRQYGLFGMEGVNCHQLKMRHGCRTGQSTQRRPQIGNEFKNSYREILGNCRRWAAYISDFDRQIAKYLKGGEPN